MIELWMRGRVGYPWALSLFECIVILTLGGLYWFGPENHGKSFSEPVIEPSETQGAA
jgi:hypothetical protein